MSELKSSDRIAGKTMTLDVGGGVTITYSAKAKSAPKASQPLTKTYNFKTSVVFSIPDGKPTQEQVDALVKLVFIKAEQQVPKNLFPNLVEVSDPVVNIVLTIIFNGKEFIYPLPEKKFHFTVKDTQFSKGEQGVNPTTSSPSSSASKTAIGGTGESLGGYIEYEL